MALRLVPFNAAWISHDKIDLHAIYRRPRFIEDNYGEWQREYDAEGLPTWDLTGPLPVKAHTKWTAKGFEYVTLADRASLETAARYGTVVDEHGVQTAHWRQLYDQHQTGGPWNWRKYAESMASTTTLAAEQLKADVQRFGSDAVEAIRRQTEPSFKLPEHLRGIPAGGTAPGSASGTAGGPATMAQEAVKAGPAGKPTGRPKAIELGRPEPAEAGA